MTDARDETSDVVPDRDGRRPRVGDSGAPVAITLSIILAVVAVIAGFLILRALTDDDSSSDEGSTIAPVETGASTATTATGGSPVGSDVATSSSTPAAETKTGATIVVANASGVPGSALAMSTALTTDGYATVGEPGNSTGDPIPASVVYYVANDPVAQAVAATLAADLGGVQSTQMIEPRPADGGGVADATVLLMLGQDAANKTLGELSGGAAAGATTVPGSSAVAPPQIVTSSSGG